MTVFDRLLRPVLPILYQLEQVRPKHGNESLTWLDLVRALVYFFTRRCGSRNAWAVALANADPTLQLPAVPRMTLSDGLGAFLLSCCVRLCENCLPRVICFLILS